MTEDQQTREAALDLAVQHHGLANHAGSAVPTGAETVIRTARQFADYIAGNPAK